MAHRLMRCCGFLLGLLGCVGAQAQAPLSDPTRPPASIFTGSPEVGGGGGPVLQSVFLPRKGKPFAVIGGQTVKLGEMYGDSRLVKLSEREAVLDGPAGIESLLLTPGIEKTNIIAKTITKTPVAKRAPRGSTP